MTQDPTDDLVRAAGSLCWRPAAGSGLELLLVRSARYGDWSWPKGKAEPAELLPVTAVREVAEETGVRVRLGRPLPAVRYVLPDGRRKRVDYWAGRPVREAARTAGADEIADAEWVPVAEARRRLTRPGDGGPLDRLLHLAARDRLDTRGLVVVRHARAVQRADWNGPDGERPLTGPGDRQAHGLAELLACWAPDRVLSSPWRRCTDTVRPYAAAAGVELVELAALTEIAAREDPHVPTQLTAKLLAGGEDLALCTHRPVLRHAVAVVRQAAGRHARRRLPGKDPYLQPAEALVAHVGRWAAGPRVWDVERHEPAAVDGP